MWRNFDDPKNKNCRTCKHIIYSGGKDVVCGFDKARKMYFGPGVRITVFDCPDWEISNDNIKHRFHPAAQRCPT